MPSLSFVLSVVAVAMDGASALTGILMLAWLKVFFMPPTIASAIPLPNFFKSPQASFTVLPRPEKMELKPSRIFFTSKEKKPSNICNSPLAGLATSLMASMMMLKATKATCPTDLNAKPIN